MGLSVSEYIRLMVEEVAQVRMPEGTLRRHGAQSRVQECLTSTVDSIKGLGDDTRSPGPVEQLRYASDRALELASYLYVAGAPFPSVRRWCALAAFGFTLQRKFVDAATYAALAGEWALVDRLGVLAPDQSSMPRPLWGLLIGAPPREVPDHGDALDLAWARLANAVSALDVNEIEAALCEIVEWWWEEDEGDWINFHPYSYPDFEAPVCAAAAAAKRRGYTPKELPPEVRRYLDAGLADGQSEPLYPTLSFLE